MTSRDVAIKLRTRIEAGVYAPDEPLPTERALSQEFKIHRATLRRSLDLLESEGLVRRSAGARTYPRTPVSAIEGTIGLYATDEDVYSRSLIAKGIVEVLRGRGSSLRLVWSDDHAFMSGEPFSPEVMGHRGLVLWPPSLIDVERLRALRGRLPTVIVDAPVTGYESDFVGFDDERGGYEAARHLVDQGHRRIAFVGALQIVTAQHRRLGFRRLMAERGLDPVVGYEALAYAARLPEGVLGAYLDALRGVGSSRRPTALLCENDETAALLMPLLAERGIRVPEELALVGFGGAQRVLLSALGLSTMEQPFVEVGRQAGRLLLERIEGVQEGNSHKVVRLPMQLKVRTSCDLARPAPNL